MNKYSWLISVIVPIYNVEQYLNRAIDSLLNQTISSVEIILVDDGSMDSSGVICDEYARRYPHRIKCIHQSNHGVSSARNAGIDISKGKYIGFVDPDDFVDLDMYAFLYKTAIETRSDVVACGWRDCYPSKNVPYQGKRYHDTIDKKQAIVREIRDGIFLSCNKLFYSACIKDIRYEVGIVNGEDRLFVIQAILNANKVTYRFEDKYNYCHRANSAGTKKFSAKDYKLLEVCRKIKCLFEKYAADYMDVANRQIVMARLQLLYMMDLDLKLYSPYGEKILSELRKYWYNEIIKNSCFSTAEKIKYTLLTFSPTIYQIFRNKLRKINGGGEQLF